MHFTIDYSFILLLHLMAYLSFLHDEDYVISV